MTKAALGVRIDVSTKEALETAANDEGRSLSNLVVRILLGWLAAHGRKVK